MRDKRKGTRVRNPGYRKYKLGIHTTTTHSANSLLEKHWNKGLRTQKGLNLLSTIFSLPLMFEFKEFPSQWNKSNELPPLGHSLVSIQPSAVLPSSANRA